MPRLHRFANPCRSVTRAACAFLLLGLFAGCSRTPVAPVAALRRAPLSSSTTAIDGLRPGIALVHYAAGTIPDSLAWNFGSQLLDVIPEIDYALLRTPLGLSVDGFTDELHLDEHVLAAGPNDRVQTAEGLQSSVAFSEGIRAWGAVADQRAFARTGAVGSHRIATGEDVRVAILDTGIDLDHHALVDVLEPGIEPGETTAPGNDRPDLVDSNGDGIVDGALGHGTHVAGIVHAMAPDARLIPVRVLDSDGVGDVFRVARGIVLAVRAGANVINLSLGLAREAPAIAAAIDYARNAGAVVVAAAGNDATPDVEFPASYPPVVSVAGTDAEDRKSAFSDYGAAVDIAAPAEAILSTYWNGSYARWSGTSMAAPFVSGTAALLYSLAGDRSPEHATMVETAVRGGADPLGAVDPDFGVLLGAGRVNALSSVLLIDPDRTDDGILEHKGGH